MTSNTIFWLVFVLAVSPAAAHPAVAGASKHIFIVAKSKLGSFFSSIGSKIGAVFGYFNSRINNFFGSIQTPRAIINVPSKVKALPKSTFKKMLNPAIPKSTNPIGNGAKMVKK
jgi:hypothetical protein